MEIDDYLEKLNHNGRIALKNEKNQFVKDQVIFRASLCGATVESETVYKNKNFLLKEWVLDKEYIRVNKIKNIKKYSIVDTMYIYFLNRINRFKEIPLNWIEEGICFLIRTCNPKQTKNILKKIFILLIKSGCYHERTYLKIDKPIQVQNEYLHNNLISYLEDLENKQKEEEKSNFYKNIYYYKGLIVSGISEVLYKNILDELINSNICFTIKIKLNQKSYLDLFPKIEKINNLKNTKKSNPQNLISSELIEEIRNNITKIYTLQFAILIKSNDPYSLDKSIDKVKEIFSEVGIRTKIVDGNHKKIFDYIVKNQDLELDEHFCTDKAVFYHLNPFINKNEKKLPIKN